MIDPLFLSIAAVIAGRGVLALYQLVKDQFADDPTATAVLEAAAGAQSDSPEVEALGAQLERSSENDRAFATRLQQMWENIGTHQHTGCHGVNNHATGHVEGNVVQTRDVHGDIHL